VEREEFSELVEAHYEGLYRFGLALSRSETDAADLVQQTFAIWARKGGQLRDRDRARAWLFTTLRREFLATVRRGMREEPLMEPDDEPAAPADLPSGLDGEAVMRALSSLPLEYREPLILFYLEDLSYTEIASILGVPMGTVMSRLSRGKARLRKLLSDET